MIKIGIVGTGGIAEWHASALKDNKNSDVVAACDVNNDRLNADKVWESFENNYGKNFHY